MTDGEIASTEVRVPSVDVLARRICGNDEPDAQALKMAQSIRSHLVASGERREGRSCSTCRHRISPGPTRAYINVCIHPLIAETEYSATTGVTTTKAVYCRKEREPQQHYGTQLCGQQGLLHEPVRAVGIMPAGRAYLRWLRVRGNISISS